MSPTVAVLLTVRVFTDRSTTAAPAALPGHVTDIQSVWKERRDKTWFCGWRFIRKVLRNVSTYLLYPTFGCLYFVQTCTATVNKPFLTLTTVCHSRWRVMGKIQGWITKGVFFVVGMCGWVWPASLTATTSLKVNPAVLCNPRTFIWSSFSLYKLQVPSFILQHFFTR